MPFKMRQPYIRYAFRLPDAGTHPEPINIKQPIMDFYIYMYATNGSTSNIGNSMLDVLNNISIVDGSDVLYSLDAEEIMALAYYHYKESIGMGIDERPNVVQGTTFKIPLGLGRVHPEVAFDPTRFANPQLVIDWNLENIRDCGVDGFVTDTLDLTIMADVVQEAPSSPLGFLMSKQIYEYQTKAAGEERVELPVDYPYRTLFVRAFLADTCPHAIIEKAKHSINEDHYIPFEIYTPDWKHWLKEWYGLWHQGYWFFLPDATQVTKNPYLRGNLSASVEGVVAADDMILPTLANCVLAIKTAAVGGTTPHVKADGNIPFETFAWPYGDPDEPEEWLILSREDKSRLILSQATALATCQVFLTQYRSY